MNSLETVSWWKALTNTFFAESTWRKNFSVISRAPDFGYELPEDSSGKTVWVFGTALPDEF
jgi:hypothetical protein